MHSQNQLKCRKESRKCERQRIHARFQISWLDEHGGVANGSGFLVDISEGGFAVELREAPRRGSRVRFVCSRLKLMGAGEIRSCNRRNNLYRVGVEFIDGARWNPASLVFSDGNWDQRFPKA